MNSWTTSITTPTPPEWALDSSQPLLFMSCQKSLRTSSGGASFSNSPQSRLLRRFTPVVSPRSKRGREFSLKFANKSWTIGVEVCVISDCEPLPPGLAATAATVSDATSLALPSPSSSATFDGPTPVGSSAIARFPTMAATAAPSSWLFPEAFGPETTKTPLGWKSTAISRNGPKFVRVRRMKCTGPLARRVEWSLLEGNLDSI